MTARNATALIDKAVLRGARPMARTLRHAVGGMIGELLAQGIKCSGLRKDQSAFTDHSYLLIRGRIQLAVRFLKGLTHFYSLFITFSEDFDPQDPGGCVSIIVDPAPIEDVSVLFGAYVEEMLAEFDDAYVLLLEKLSDYRSMSSALDDVIQSGRPLLIIVNVVESEALAMLIPDCMQAGLKIAVVKAPGFGDRRKVMLKDIAILTGGQLVSDGVATNLGDLNVGLFGRAQKIVISKSNVTIKGGDGTMKGIEARRVRIKAQIKKATTAYEREELLGRPAVFASGIAVIRAGTNAEASTKAEIEIAKGKVTAETNTMANECFLSDHAQPAYPLRAFDEVVGHSSGTQDEIRTVAIGSKIGEALKGPTSPTI